MQRPVISGTKDLQRAGDRSWCAEHREFVENVMAVPLLGTPVAVCPQCFEAEEEEVYDGKTFEKIT